MTNIEYLYKKGLQLDLPIQLQQASEELGFYPNLHYWVITGKSEIGEMRLYQEEDGLFEYVFDLQYVRRKLFSKKKVFVNTHWHPRGYQKAMDDMIVFMKGDKDYFRRVMKIDVE